MTLKHEQNLKLKQINLIGASQLPEAIFSDVEILTINEPKLTES